MALVFKSFSMWIFWSSRSGLVVMVSSKPWRCRAVSALRHVNMNKTRIQSCHRVASWSRYDSRTNTFIRCQGSSIIFIFIFIFTPEQQHHLHLHPSGVAEHCRDVAPTRSSACAWREELIKWSMLKVDEINSLTPDQEKKLWKNA